MNIQTIDDPQDARIKHFAVRRYHPLEQLGLFVIDSEKVIERAMQRRIILRSLLLTPQHFERHHLALYTYAAQMGIQVGQDAETLTIFIANEHVIAEVCGHYVHQGMMALAVPTLGVRLEQLGDKVVILNNVSDPQNTGTILRNAHAFGMTGIILDATSSPLFVRRSIRVSMGSAFYLKHYRSTDLIADLQYLRQQLGFEIIGSSLSSRSIDLPQLTWPRKFAVIIGNEDKGMSASIAEQCQHLVRIPMAPDIDSINAAQASAVLFYESNRQRSSSTPLKETQFGEIQESFE